MPIEVLFIFYIIDIFKRKTSVKNCSIFLPGLILTIRIQTLLNHTEQSGEILT